MSILFTLTLKDKLALFFNSGTSLIGLAFFLFGMIFVLVFGSAADFSALRFWVSPTSTTTGTVIERSPTSYSENERNIAKYNFKYEIQGIKHYGKSYSSTQWLAENETVTVEYLSYNPKISRIQGMKRRPFALWIIFLVGIFPLIGLLFILYNLIYAIRQISILDNSALAMGKLIHSTRTNTQINNRYLYKMEFEYTIHGRKYQNITRTTRPVILEDELEEPLIYSIRRPEKSVLFDTLPESLQEKLFQKFPSLKNR